ncbi:hypothetical protein L2E82_22910 [Cichorium intybus]|uniref:Uncharacterized protein n=1 Tax=Cichorium intybus TaxID=13427 RepID=A0ACB9DYW0_CICIN|nr:hypothetical protein L2E82_22910 [Cichorium intybus]
MQEKHGAGFGKDLDREIEIGAPYQVFCHMSLWEEARALAVWWILLVDSTMELGQGYQISLGCGFWPIN